MFKFKILYLILQTIFFWLLLSIVGIFAINKINLIKLIYVLKLFIFIDINK